MIGCHPDRCWQPKKSHAVELGTKGVEEPVEEQEKFVRLSKDVVIPERQAAFEAESTKVRSTRGYFCSKVGGSCSNSKVRASGRQRRVAVADYPHYPPCASCRRPPVTRRWASSSSPSSCVRSTSAGALTSRRPKGSFARYSGLEWSSSRVASLSALQFLVEGFFVGKCSTQGGDLWQYGKVEAPPAEKAVPVEVAQSAPNVGSGAVGAHGGELATLCRRRRASKSWQRRGPSCRRKRARPRRRPARRRPPLRSCAARAAASSCGGATRAACRASS